MDFFTYEDDEVLIVIDVADIRSLSFGRENDAKALLELKEGSSKYLHPEIAEALFTKLRTLDSMYCMVEEPPEQVPQYMGQVIDKPDFI